MCFIIKSCPLGESSFYREYIIKFVSISILGNYVKSEHMFSYIFSGFEEKNIYINYRYITLLHCIDNTLHAAVRFG